MKLPQIKGIVHSISTPVKITSMLGTSHRQQSIIVLVPGYTDQFGDKKSQDDYFEFQLFNDQIEKEDLLSKDLQDKKVIVEGYLSGRVYKKSGLEVCSHPIKLKSIEIFK